MYFIWYIYIAAKKKQKVFNNSICLFYANDYLKVNQSTDTLKIALDILALKD